LIGQLDVAAARSFVAPAARDVTDGIAAAAEHKHGLAVPERQDELGTDDVRGAENSSNDDEDGTDNAAKRSGSG
jgi:hypothetical protein